MPTIITADRVSGSFTSTGSLGQLSLGGTSTSGSIQPSSSLHIQGNGAEGGIHMFRDAFPNQYGMRYYLVDSGADGQYLRFESQRASNWTEVLRIGNGGNASNQTLQLVTGNISGSVESTASFGALRVEAEEDGTTITTDRFGLTIDGQVGYYPLTVQSPYETAARFISTDGTANIEIGDNSSTQNHNRIQVVGDVMELVAANSKRVELSSGNIVFNQDSDDVNFRIESNDNQNMVFIDGGKNHMSIGMSRGNHTSDEILVVAGNTGITGSLHVSGNISTSGSIIAKEFRTEFVNQIIATSSGSTTFGDDLADTHRFTGSVNITGSITIPTGSITVEGGIGGANIARFSRNQGTQRTDIDIHAGSGDPQLTFSSPSGRDYSIGQDISENSFAMIEPEVEILPETCSEPVTPTFPATVNFS